MPETVLQINNSNNVVQVTQNSTQQLTLTSTGNKQLVNVVAAGPQGPQGPPGLATIGGYGFNIAGLTAGDVLSFSGSAWYNRDDESVTDGGNF